MKILLVVSQRRQTSRTRRRPGRAGAEAALLVLDPIKLFRAYMFIQLIVFIGSELLLTAAPLEGAFLKDPVSRLAGLLKLCWCYDVVRNSRDSRQRQKQSDKEDAHRLCG